MPEDKTLCPLKYLTSLFGGKWKMPIICILSGYESVRYSVIKRRLGDITNMMLAKSLRELEADGMINRIQYNEIPPHVEYSLTDKGKSSLPMLTSAAEWAIREMNDKAFCEKCSTIL